MDESLPPTTSTINFLLKARRINNLLVTSQAGASNQSDSGGGHNVHSAHNRSSGQSKHFTGVSGTDNSQYVLEETTCTATAVHGRTIQDRAFSPSGTHTLRDESIISDVTTSSDTCYSTSVISNLEVPLPSANDSRLVHYPSTDFQPSGHTITEAENARLDASLKPVIDQPTGMADTPNGFFSTRRNVALKRDRVPGVEDETTTLHVGEVFTIAGEGLAQIDQMTMIAMAKSSADRYLCLGLKCHWGLTPRKPFADKNALVVDAASENPPKTWAGCKPDVVRIEFNEANGTTLLDDCWVSYEHIYTIREVNIMREGHVVNMSDMFPKFRKAQKVMWDKVEEELKTFEKDST